jgi:hypothetical protein
MTFTKILFKTAIFTLAILQLFTIACSNDPNKTTKLKVNGVEPSEQITLKVYDTTGAAKAEVNRKVKDDYQEFSFKASHPKIYIIEARNETFELIIQPGEKAEININVTNNETVGTRNALSPKYSLSIQQIELKAENQNHQEYLNRLHPLEKQLDSLAYLFITSQSTDSFAIVREKVNEQIIALVDVAKEISVDYIQKHGSSIGIYIALNRVIREMPVFSYMDDWRSVLMTDSILRKHHPHHPYSIRLGNHVKMMDDYLAEITRIKPGTIIPQISLPSLDGKTKSVIPHPNGITLIHLWEDSPYNRNKNKEVKLLHEKYGSEKIKFYSICFDNNIQRWSAAVTIDKMWWNNLVDSKVEGSHLLAQLNNPRLPSFIVVDNNMKVLGYFRSTLLLDKWTEQYFSGSTSKKTLN